MRSLAAKLFVADETAHAKNESAPLRAEGSARIPFAVDESWPPAKTVKLALIAAAILFVALSLPFIFHAVN
jgi:hypothetical protein